MNWIDTEFSFFFHPSDDIDSFMDFLENTSHEIDSDSELYSGIFTIDGKLGWFEEKIFSEFYDVMQEKISPNGSLVKLRLKYLYTVNPGDETEKIFYNGESLFGD